MQKALTAGGFLERTPWFYVLKVAELRAGGNSPGEVGSRIVVETIVGQVRNDADSYLSFAIPPSYARVFPTRPGAVTGPGDSA